MQGLFELGGLLATLAAVAIYKCYDGFSMRNMRQFWAALLVAIPLVGGALVALANAKGPNITAVIFGSRGLGPGWDCNVAPRSAQICFRENPSPNPAPHTEELKSAR